MSVVFVLAPNRTPLMPCHPAIARLLLKEGKAKVRRRTPFTIQLRTQPEQRYTQPLTLGLDTGSSIVGSAVADEQGKVFYLSEVEIRNDIAKTMKERAAARRNRRNRKTRYRSARWLKMSTGYAILMDIHGNKVALKPIPKFEKMRRVSARSSWMLIQQPLPITHTQ